MILENVFCFVLFNFGLVIHNNNLKTEKKD